MKDLASMSLLPKRPLLIALALLPLFAAGAALADDAAPAPNSRHPCMADRQKFCGGVEPGEGRIVACMKSHEADLSPACKAAFARHEQRHPAGGAATPDAPK
jgi:hypothetical protein